MEKCFKDPLLPFEEMHVKIKTLLYLGCLFKIPPLYFQYEWVDKMGELEVKIKSFTRGQVKVSLILYTVSPLLWLQSNSNEPCKGKQRTKHSLAHRVHT